MKKQEFFKENSEDEDIQISLWTVQEKQMWIFYKQKKKQNHLLFLLYIYFLTRMNTAEAVYAETELKKKLMEAQTH